MDLFQVSNNYDRTEKKKKSSMISVDSLNEMSQREDLEPKINKIKVRVTFIKPKESRTFDFNT